VTRTERPLDPVEFLERAVPIDTTAAVPELRDLLVERLADHGVDATVDDAGTVLASRGTDEGSDHPHVVLNTHLDTVPPHLPFERDGDAVRGRGACDAKGPLAAMLAAFLAVDPGEGRLALAITPDEETASRGAATLVERGLVDGADGVIVGEPTGLDVCNAARGRFQAAVTVEGENAHAAEPDAGVNAIRAAAPVIDALDGFDERSDAPGDHPTLGAPTLVPTVAEGGGAANQVPAAFRIVLDRRSVPPERADQFRAALGAHLGAAAPGEATVRVELADRETPFLEAFETPADSRVARALRDAAGGDVRPFGAATEASYFAGRAPTVVFGPGDLADDEGPVAHADREYVRIDDVRAAADALDGALAALFS
jgi:acetylornithine deacetylase